MHIVIIVTYLVYIIHNLPQFLLPFMCSTVNGTEEVGDFHYKCHAYVDSSVRGIHLYQYQCDQLYQRHSEIGIYMLMRVTHPPEMKSQNQIFFFHTYLNIGVSCKHKKTSQTFPTFYLFPKQGTLCQFIKNATLRTLAV